MTKRTKLTLLDRILTKDFTGLVNQVTHFRYQAKKLRFVASNNYFDVTAMQAVSYNWWTYFAEVDGIAVFNKHAYSPSTRRHQSRMRSLLSKLGIRIDVEVDTRSSLDGMSIQDIYDKLITERMKLNLEVANCKRPKSAKKAAIESKIFWVQESIDTLKAHAIQEAV